MNEEIEKLNEWLREKSKKADMGWVKNSYNSLLDIDTLDSFMVGSGIFIMESPLKEYLLKHQDEYYTNPATGSCTYYKKTKLPIV